MILFCLPHAGGSEAIYYSWKKHLHPAIKLEPICLKGRGRRYDEGFYEDFNEAVDDIFSNVKDTIMSDEYAIFGHSMGSHLAYELYYRTCDENLPKPRHIFFSGSAAPSVEKDREILHTLPDDEFLKEVIDLGGTPEELIESDELLKIALPILRNDFRIFENRIYEKRSKKIECNVTVFSGKEDDFILEELLVWRDHCSLGFKLHMLEGNHFFINDNIESITNIIKSELK